MLYNSLRLRSCFSFLLLFDFFIVYLFICLISYLTWLFFNSLLRYHLFLIIILNLWNWLFYRFTLLPFWLLYTSPLIYLISLFLLSLCTLNRLSNWRGRPCNIGTLFIGTWAWRGYFFRNGWWRTPK